MSQRQENCKCSMLCCTTATITFIICNNLMFITAEELLPMKN